MERRQAPIPAAEVNEGWQNVPLRDYPCALCGSESSRVVLQKEGALVRRTFNVVRCTACGHVRVSPRIPDDIIPDLYDNDYFNGRGFDRTVNYAAAASNDYRNSDIVRAIIRTVAQLFPSGSTIRSLDIGCGLGDLVLGMRDRGFESYGIDSSPESRAILHDRRVPVIDDLDEAPEKYEGSFDLVTCVEVIEHVTDPAGFLRYAKRWLRPGGFLFVLTGNWNIERRVPGTPYVMPEGHIHYFTPGTLRAFMQTAGFQTIRVPVNYVWFGNRFAPGGTPRALRRALQASFEMIFPGYGPLTVAKKPF